MLGKRECHTDRWLGKLKKKSNSPVTKGLLGCMGGSCSVSWIGCDMKKWIGVCGEIKTGMCVNKAFRVIFIFSVGCVYKEAIKSVSIYCDIKCLEWCSREKNRLALNAMEIKFVYRENIVLGHVDLI